MSNIRWGIKYTSDFSKDSEYLQDKLLEDINFAKRGELFLNEARKSIYYKDENNLFQEITGSYGAFYLNKDIIDQNYYIQNKDKLIVKATSNIELITPLTEEEDAYFWILNFSNEVFHINAADTYLIENDATYIINPVDRSLLFQRVGNNWRLISEKDINNINIPWVLPPVSSNSTGTTGQIAHDQDYLYICVDTDTWTRTSLETW